MNRLAIESKVIAVATETVEDWGLDLPGGSRVTPN